MLASTQVAKSGAVEAPPVTARVSSFSWSLRIAAAIAVMAFAVRRGWPCVLLRP